jgi:hypothetical protein
MVVEAVMLRHEFATGAFLAVFLLAGCNSAPDYAYSQQGAIRDDMDASFQHGPSVTDHELGIQFNNNLDDAANGRPTSFTGALGFRQGE